MGGAIANARYTARAWACRGPAVRSQQIGTRRFIPEYSGLAYSTLAAPITLDTDFAWRVEAAVNAGSTGSRVLLGSDGGLLLYVNSAAGGANLVARVPLAGGGYTYPAHPLTGLEDGLLRTYGLRLSAGQLYLSVDGDEVGPALINHGPLAIDRIGVQDSGSSLLTGHILSVRLDRPGQPTLLWRLDAARTDYSLPMGAGVGPELVKNGTFDTDTDWAKPPTWSIAGGELVCNSPGATSGDCYQGAEITNGEKYLMAFTLSSYSAGSVRFNCGYFGGAAGVYRNAAGNYTQILTATGVYQRVVLQGGTGGFVGAIDCVSVRRLPDTALIHANLAAPEVYVRRPGGAYASLDGATVLERA